LLKVFQLIEDYYNIQIYFYSTKLLTNETCGLGMVVVYHH
jgi:hypothetical protein